MKKLIKPLIFLGIFNLIILIFIGFTPEKRSGYVVIGWNSLGMHCANKYFNDICVLPPYNDVLAVAIQVGNSTTKPKILTTGYKISYSIPGNTYSVGKTDFWTYDSLIFGVKHANNIGLKGNGLTGNMVALTDHFIAEGIPLTPYTDANMTTENPFQLGLLKLYDGSNNLLASTQPVIPVSNQIGCVSSGCHSSINSILNSHPTDHGFNPNKRPIFCASCHSSNALGAPGIAGVLSLSQQIHQEHAGVTTDCYKCHPGQTTKCLRDTMFSRGFTCQNCHGDLANVASSIDTGRQPWLIEPSCYDNVDCHKSTIYAPEPGKLYRNSKGHSGLYCAACHGAPHAIYPTIQPNDNVQNIALQGFKGKLKKCSVCHGVTPTSAGPHNFLPSDIETKSSQIPNENALLANYPNPFDVSTTIPFKVKENARVRLDIYSLKGELVITPVWDNMTPGTYKVDLDAKNLESGTYFALLTVNNLTYARKIVVFRR